MHIYFIKESALGSIKIGISRSVADRLSQLQRNMPQKLECLGFIEGNFSDEKILHEKFSHLKIRGEWFREDNELSDFLSTLDLKPIEPKKKIKPSSYRFGNKSNRIFLSTRNL